MLEKEIQTIYYEALKRSISLDSGGMNMLKNSEIASEAPDQRITVVCRVRSVGSIEKPSQLLKIEGSNINVTSLGKKFFFDLAAGANMSQEEFFNVVGRPAVQNCIEGFNGTIICYGQTGSGKTFTIFGDNSKRSSRGLVPRVLDYLWDHITHEKERTNHGVGKLSYLCKCSFLEIYQEIVYDLLEIAGNSSSGLKIREDAKSGVFVENLIEEIVNSPEEAGKVLAAGFRNRHTSETAMNRESSRSHAIFQLTIIATENQGDGIMTSRSARFTMVDLAGSERQRDTHTSGDRLKEAGQINSSLSALGKVINALAENSESNGKRHVPYRDSRLTFFLRDSLGGNSKVNILVIYTI